ncbi:MAG: O-methyltransferase [Acidobacteria bacterium]|nr:O-methyltransferase [Acidobacteriota bacterium]MBI3472270.1 O-methyltransferase [Candidatus Solibacter usitatus]
MIVHPDIERYLDSLLPPRDAALAEMEALAARRQIPIIGPATARLLAALVRISGAKRIFELGSAIGYSTLWLAQAAGEGAEVHYSDGSADNARVARGFFERAGVASRLHIHVGDALEALAATPGVFDLIFNDVDKEGYLAVLEAVPSRLRKGGLFLTDNTLWHARVLDPREEADHAVVEFNRRLYASPDFFTALVPIRDGVSVSLRT